MTKKERKIGTIGISSQIWLCILVCNYREIDNTIYLDFFIDNIVTAFSYVNFFVPLILFDSLFLFRKELGSVMPFPGSYLALGQQFGHRTDNTDNIE